jgi:DNA polymerase (family 10)
MNLSDLLFLFKKHLENAVKKDDPSAMFIGLAYLDVIDILKSNFYKDDIITFDKIKNMNITEHMKNKLKKIIETELVPSNKQPELHKNNLIDELIQVAGIGKAKANFLVKLGLTNINDLNKPPFSNHITEATKLLLKYKPEREIPNSIITKLNPILTTYPNTVLVGSFRRKTTISKDIDIMLVSDNKLSLENYINKLKNDVDEIYVYSKGIDKISFIFLYSKVSTKYFKVDVFRTPKKYKYAMLLYSTGSKQTNIMLRKLALKKGYTLNQKGLYFKNKEIILNSEKHIFDILGIPFIKPEDR